MLKVLRYNRKNSSNILTSFLEKRKVAQRYQTAIVTKIIKNVKKRGDSAVLKYEKKFSKLKTKTTKISFSNQEINAISKKIDKKLKSAIDLAYNRIKKFHFQIKR